MSPASFFSTTRPLSKLSLMGLFLMSCNPWQDVYEREVHWQKELLSSSGLNPPKLTHARPLNRSLRITIHPDRIELDNRAWWLSLSDAFFLSDEAEEEAQLTLLFEEVLPLEQGIFSPSELEGVYHPKLQELTEAYFKSTLMSKFSEASKLLGERELSSRNEAIIVANEEIPLSTIYTVIYSVGGWTPDITFAGLYGETLSGIVSAPPPPSGKRNEVWGDQLNTLSCQLHVETKHVWIQCSDRSIDPFFSNGGPSPYPPLSLSTSCRSADWQGLLQSFQQLQSACFSNASQTPIYPHHYEERRSYGPSEPSEPKPDDSVRLTLSSSSLTYGVWSELMSYGYELYPQLKLNYYPLITEHEASDCPFGVNLTKLNRQGRAALCHRFFGVGKSDLFPEVFPEFHQWVVENTPEPPEPLKSNSSFQELFSAP